MDKKALQEIMFKEVDIIQDIIKRMASNSFLIKGWTVTLVVGTFLLKGEYYQMFFAFIPLVAFWYLDAFFLRQEKLYRKLYKWVVTNRMSDETNILDMNAKRFQDKVASETKIMFSITLNWFYIPIALIIGIYIYVNLLISIIGGK